MKKKRSSHLPIAELIMVKADWNRTFIGSIKRDVDDNGNHVIRGAVIIREGKIWSVAESEEQISRNLDELCILKLDKKIHSIAGISCKLCRLDFFLN